MLLSHRSRGGEQRRCAYQRDEQIALGNPESRQMSRKSPGTEPPFGASAEAEDWPPRP